jgi:hypothetical protein
MSKLSVFRFVFLIFSIFALSAGVYSPVVQAEESMPTSIIPLEITPVCSDATSGLAQWKVFNKNEEAVAIHWTNLGNNVSGDYNAVTGESAMITSYNGADPNNTTRFMSGTDTNQTNAQNVPCTIVVEPPVEPADECIDGSISDNLIVEFITKNTVTITVKDNQMLCDNVDVYVSSYVMPANYNGNPFAGNPTAYPQTIFDSVKVTLSAQTAINETVTINLPDDCNNIQLDVYYAPEITTVGPEGHGEANIASMVYDASNECEVVPGKGGETPTEPEQPTTPVNTPVLPIASIGKGASSDTLSSSTVSSDTELANTGTGALANLMFAPIVVLITAYLASDSYRIRRKKY